MIIDSRLYNHDAETRAWLISKINRISPDGIVRVTLAQDTYDQHNDYIERDTDGSVIGMWANYYNSNLEPTFVPEDEPISTVTSIVTCTGKPQFKVGGSAKTFTVTYYDDENQEITDHEVGSWALSIGSDTLDSELYELIPVTDAPCKIKIKFLGDDAYIGKILTISNTSDDSSSFIDVEILPL